MSADPVTFVLAVAIAAGISMGVFAHANHHGSRHATAWGVAAFLAAAVAVPVYVVRYWVRRRRGQPRPPGLTGCTPRHGVVSRVANLRVPCDDLPVMVTRARIGWFGMVVDLPVETQADPQSQGWADSDLNARTPWPRQNSAYE